MKFRIKYQNSDGTVGHYEIEATDATSAGETFYNYYSSKIINIDNLTAKDNAFHVANFLISLSKTSSNPEIQKMASFSKPVAALAEQLLDQYHHVVSNENIDNVEEMAKEILRRMIGR